ncbi:MAG: ATP synthase F1 subunit gamma [Candidatus Aminicenantia bacterium]
MSTVLDLRRKIKTIRNIQQITKAMKTVATVKLKRAQQSLLHIKPYSHRIPELIESLTSRVDLSLHPLLSERKEKRIELVIITADKGLCGAFNSKIREKAEEFIGEKKDEIEISFTLIGKKGAIYFKKEPYPVRNKYINLFQKLEYEKVKEIVKSLIDPFLNQEIDAVYVIYNEFKSILRQEITINRLLPLPRFEPKEEVVIIDYIYEPDPEAILNQLLPKYIENQIYHYLLESIASEHAARMIAMENATNNAQELIEDLSLEMNKIRQTLITKELVNIMTAVEALEER